VSLSWTGNLFNAQDLILQPFQQQVALMWPTARLLAPRGTALSGADLLVCSNPPPMFEDCCTCSRVSLGRDVAT